MNLSEKFSENCEESLNSLEAQYEPCLLTYRNSLDSDQCEQGLSQTKCLPVSCSEVTAEENDVPWDQLQQSQRCCKDTKAICRGDSSKFSRESSNCVGSNVSVPRLLWFKNMSKIVGLTAAWQHGKVEGASMGANTARKAKVNNTP